MRLHKEGNRILSGSLAIFIFILLIEKIVLANFPIVFYITAFILLVLYILIVRFFRMPARTITINNNHILCPCDGKVVVIEEVEETEFFNDKRLQVSIFMSPNNVHVNRYPIGGIVRYMKYHPGKYLVAWHPKSSTENERTTVVVEMDNGTKVLTRQIAGAVARRIVCYSKEGMKVNQGDELGFIKFGSRVDLLLPLDVKIEVQINQIVKGGQTVIASFKAKII
jgi:phosphatidylserine decarboxylase